MEVDGPDFRIPIGGFHSTSIIIADSVPGAWSHPEVILSGRPSSHLSSGVALGTYWNPICQDLQVLSL